MRKGLSALAAALLLLPAACTQPGTPPPTVSAPIAYLPALAGDYFPITSRETGTTYHIYIAYPESYRQHPLRKYPIFYLLDGDSLFPYLAPHHLLLTYDDKVPEALLVGIAYGSFGEGNRRRVDFGDGAAAFHAFLKRELLPAVEARVRGDRARRILVGQSLGGGFILYSAYSDPGLFWGRIASNPTFQSHRSLVLGRPPAATGADTRLAVASGTRDVPAIRAGTLEWFAAHQSRPGPWRFNRIELQDGTHAADMPNVYRRAVNWLFGSPQK